MTQNTDSQPPVAMPSGKTKTAAPFGDDGLRFEFTQFDDLTRLDGAVRDKMKGKAICATATNTHVMEFLRANGVPVAFDHQSAPDKYVTQATQMLPYEVIWSRKPIAKSSFIKRHPWMKPDVRVETARVMFHLKTSGGVFEGIELPAGKAPDGTELSRDDPIITSINPSGMMVHNAAKPVVAEEGVHIPPSALGWKDNGGEGDYIDPFGEMERLTRLVGLLLEKGFELIGITLLDIKIEYGVLPNGKVVVSDVLDADSGRMQDRAGNHLDKQNWRNGGSVEETAVGYALIAELTKRFREIVELRPRILLWRASGQDDVVPFEQAVARSDAADLTVMTGSLHKQPVQSLARLHHYLGASLANTVIIVYVGRSNGAGPVIAAATHVPVITVPANAKEFPEDVWSSLRTPSEVPLMTVLSPDNAVMAALGILATTSPQAYAVVRSLQEARGLDESNSPTFGTNY